MKTYKIKERVYIDDNAKYGMDNRTIVIYQKIKELKSEIFIRPRTSTNMMIDIELTYNVQEIGYHPRKLFIDTYYLYNIDALKN